MKNELGFPQYSEPVIRDVSEEEFEARPGPWPRMLIQRLGVYDPLTRRYINSLVRLRIDEEVENASN